MSVAEDLILQYLDGEIGAEDFEVLQDLLRRDEGVRELYFEHVAFEHTLASLVGEQSSPGARLARLRNGSMSRGTWRWAGLAAVAVLVMGVFLGMSILREPAEEGAEMRFSANSSWEIEGGERGGERVLRKGQVLTVEYGAVELQFPNDVVGLVEGPARLRMVEDGVVFLEKGRGSFLVSEAGHGFRVNTDRMSVVDLGTAFTVISGWGVRDEVHVRLGTVEAGLGGSMTVLKKGEAWGVGDDGRGGRIEYREGHFRDQLPGAVRLVFEDDFERGGIWDGGISKVGLSEWSPVGSLKGGVFNPNGSGEYYQNAGLGDDGNLQGILEGMRGPNVGYIYGVGKKGFERQVGEVSDEGVYILQLSLGVRGNKRAIYGGYTLALMSGGKVLKEFRSDEVPGPRNEFTRLTFDWDSKELPEGVEVGDPLVFRIMTNGLGSSRWCYLDFDFLRLSFTASGE